jgi:hypothetical protein
MPRSNNFLGSKDDEHRRKCIELHLTTTISLDEILSKNNKTTN